MTEARFQFANPVSTRKNLVDPRHGHTVDPTTGAQTYGIRLVRHWPGDQDGEHVLYGKDGPEDVINLVNAIVSCVPEPVATELLEKAGVTPPGEELTGLDRAKCWIEAVQRAIDARTFLPTG